MILRYVEVENFLTHTHEQISLPDHGLILLAGRSGAGKSSLVVDAVGFALFGVRATRARKVEELRRTGAEGAPMRVKIALADDTGRVVEIERGLDEGGRSWATLVDSAGAFAEGAAAVAEQLRLLLGRLDPGVYHHAFVTRQNDLAALTAMEGSRRRDFVHRMLGIDALDDMTTKLRARRRDADALLKALGPEACDLDDVRAAHASAAAAHTRAQETHRTARTCAEAAEAERVRTQAALAPLRAAWDERERAERDYLSARTELAQLRQRRHVQRRAADLAAQAATVPALTGERDRARTQLAMIEEAQALHAERAQLNVTVPEGEDLAQARAHLGELEAEGKALRAHLADTEANQAQLRADRVCPTCLREDDTDGDLATRLEAHRDAIAARLDASRDRWRAAKEAVVAAESREGARQAALAAQARAQVIDARLGDLGHQNPPAREQHTMLRTELDRLEGQLARAQAAAEEAATLTPPSADQATARTDALARALAARAVLAQPAPASRTHAERDWVAATEAARVASEASVRAEGAVETARVQAAAADAALVRAQEETARRAAAEADRRAAEDLIGLVAEFKQQLATEIRPQIEEMCSEIMNALSGGRHPQISISADYEVELRTEHSSQWLPVRMISGGEEARANFALRIALTRLVSQRTASPLRYLVLDEIFAAQDADHRTAILSTLRGLAPFYPQVFLISHVGDLAEQALVDYAVEVDDVPGAGRVSVRST